MQMEIIACGIMRDDAQKEMLSKYIERITRWPVQIKEVTVKNAASLPSEQIKKSEAEQILKMDQGPSDYWIMLDEKGKERSSMQISQHLSELEQDGYIKNVKWVIGGADGLSRELRQRANDLMSFGRQTWPHMLARIMLSEQIYRAQQIILNSPYHREG